MRKPAYAFIKEWFDKRQGRVRRRFRRRGFKSIELPGPLGSPEFMRAYESAMADAPPSLGAKKRSRPGTVSAAIAGYYSSEQYFGTLESSTQASPRALLERFRQEHGERTLADMPPKFLKLYLSALKPHAALNMCKALRHFMAYAVSVELVEEDPTRGIKLKTPATDGFHSWDDNEIAAYRAKYPLGTQERLAAEIAANLGLRCGDVAKVGRQDMQAEPDPQGRWQNVIVYRATKTRKSRSADALRVPVLPDLQEALDAMPVSPHLTFLTDEGQPFKDKDLSKAFSGWAREAGLPAGYNARFAKAGRSSSGGSRMFRDGDPGDPRAHRPEERRNLRPCGQQGEARQGGYGAGDCRGMSENKRRSKKCHTWKT